jgi:hypothetical protein
MIMIMVLPLKGLEATCWRNMVWTAVYFLSLSLLEAPNADESFWRDFARGSISGVIATTCNNGFDVVKSRTQQAGAVSSRAFQVGSAVERRWNEHWTLPNLVYLVKTEGLAGVYR